MAETGDVQTERAFQKQRNICLVSKKPVKKWLNKKKQLRWWKNVGLGFETPREAIEGTYIDHKCPFTGDVSIRGRILRGVIVRGKAKRTIVIRRNYLHYVPKYQRYEKRHKHVKAHISPCFHFQMGDEAVVGECRPLSRNIRFNVLKINPKSKKRPGMKKFKKK
eukprot:RCo004107